MTALANHPFIRGGRLHGIRFDPESYGYNNSTQNADEPITIYAEYEEIQEDTVRSKKRHTASNNRKSRIIAATGITALIGVTAALAILFSGSLTSGGEIATTAVVDENIQTPVAAMQPAAVSSLPEITNGRIPDDYPGVYPGEQVVLYHLAPLTTDRLVDERSPDGCVWQRVVGKQAGILAYPKIGSNNQQVCPVGVKGVIPLKIRMTKNTLPDEPGSMLKIVDILDAQTGASIISKAIFQPNQAEQLQAGTTIASVSNIPAQQAPSRAAVIRTAADAGSAPVVPGMRNVGSAAIPVLPPPGYYNPGVPARQVAAQIPAQTRAPAQQRPLGPLEPVRRTAPYIPPENDVMVSITGKPASDGTLNPIRPGAGMQGGQQRQQPQSDPNEVMVSISGKE